LLPGGRPGRRFTGADDDDPIAAGRDSKAHKHIYKGGKFCT
jgi:hypothetical protein